MARLNITIPDMLYTRLEQLRDRINLSKVCAVALEKEATMLEGQPNITDPRIAQLLQRLQSTRERWRQRGSEDGLQWAVELATRDELQGVATHMAEMGGPQLAALFHMQQRNLHFTTSHSPLSATHMHPSMPPGQKVVIHQPMPPAPGMPPMPPVPEPGFHLHHSGIPFPGFPQSFHPAERIRYWEDQDRELSGQATPGEAAHIEVDETAYLEGWRDTVKGIWQTIAPSLS